MNAAAEAPTIFNVTHHKAGSTWIDAILQRCVPDKVVKAKTKSAHILVDPIQAGKVYTRGYVTREQFNALELPPGATRFVVVRDLRDTLVSAYFSLRFSHVTTGLPWVAEKRSRVKQVSFKEGLEDVARSWMVVKAADIQRSWVEAGESLIRYEDLLANDSEILERVLIDDCGLEVEPRRLRAAIRSSRFAAMSGGRGHGDEDHKAHQRKGVAGDWRNYLHGSLKDSVKREWGELLIATGYEKDLDW